MKAVTLPSAKRGSDTTRSQWQPRVSLAAYSSRQHRKVGNGCVHFMDEAFEATGYVEYAKLHSHNKAVQLGKY